MATVEQKDGGGGREVGRRWVGERWGGGVAVVGRK